jgi:hypothetical protein
MTRAAARTALGTRWRTDPQVPIRASANPGKCDPARRTLFAYPRVPQARLIKLNPCPTSKPRRCRGADDDFV